MKKDNIKEVNEPEINMISTNTNLGLDLDGSTKKTQKWKLDHENFIQNIKFNKKIKGMEMRGEDTTNLRPPETFNPDYVPCPHCLRKFAPSK